MREIGDRPAGAVFDSAYARYSQADNVRLEHTLGVITEFVDRRRCEAYLNARWHVPAVVPDSR
jgi:hypothetical protein